MEPKAAETILRYQKEIQGTQKNIRQNIFLAVLIALTGLVLSARLFMANGLVDKSVELTKLNRQIDLIETENNKLEAENRSYTSFAAISNRAQTLGFVKVNSYSYLPGAETVATNLISPVN